MSPYSCSLRTVVVRIMLFSLLCQGDWTLSSTPTTTILLAEAVVQERASIESIAAITSTSTHTDSVSSPQYQKQKQNLQISETSIYSRPFNEMPRNKEQQQPQQPHHEQQRQLQVAGSSRTQLVTGSTAPSTVPPTTGVPFPTTTSLPITRLPTRAPTTNRPSATPTRAPTRRPSSAPSTPLPSTSPSASPISTPSVSPSAYPTPTPSVSPSHVPTVTPTASPTRAPSTSPSRIPSRLPTASPSYLPSVSPSASPTTKPSNGPSSAPTSLPSKAPSSPPTDVASVAPSHPPSTAPSITPTGVPTIAPTTAAPSISLQPSSEPTRTAMPTLDPFGVDERIELDDNDNRAIIVTCRPDIPSTVLDASNNNNNNDNSVMLTQLIAYDYILNVENGTVVPLVLADIEETISHRLTTILLDCQFNAIRPFYVYALNSAPNDRVVSGCLVEETVPGATCYTIAGQLSANLFYQVQNTTTADDSGQRQRRRALENFARNKAGAQKRSLQSFGTPERQFADPNIAEVFNDALGIIFQQEGLGGDGVVGSTFTGISNEVPPPPPPPPNRTPLIVGSVFGSLIGAAAIVAVIVYFAKRHTQEAETQYYQQAMDAVDSGIDDVETVPPAMATAPRTYVVNDEDDEAEETANMQVYSATKQDTSRAVEFIGTAATNTAPPSPDQQSKMLEDTQRELGPATYDAKISRGYGVSDTVDL